MSRMPKVSKKKKALPKPKKSPKKVLITGAAGFIGHHLVEYILHNTDWEITTLDRLDTSGNLNRLTAIKDWEKLKSRVRIVHHDLKAEISPTVAQMLHGPFDYILHLAAGSHVDRSIQDPALFFQDNCFATVNLLNYARNGGLRPIPNSDPLSRKPAFAGKFQFFSTDEVYGPSAPNVRHKEWDRHNPNNPYAASKSAGEQACIAFAHTYRMPIFITNCMNVFGERQYREKYIPIVIRKILSGEKLSVHSNLERTQAGARQYIHAKNISAATVWLLENGKILDGSATQGKYNVAGEAEIDNLALAILIERYINEYFAEKKQKKKVLKYELVAFDRSRPGHDIRYSVDGSLLAKEGFSYPLAFEQGLRTVVRWTIDHPDWL